MACPVDREISDSLDAFHTQFWTSVKGDNKSLISFLSAWKSFEQRLGYCIPRLRAETVERVYGFSEIVASVVEGLAVALALSDKVKEDVPGFLSNPELNDSEDEMLGSLPPYFKLASQWLLANLHNPYPSSKVKESMALQTGSPRKDIDHWFSEARKRVGWGDIRRKHFNNKQAGVVDAARRFFLDTDPSQPLPQVVESAFASVQLRAQELYSAKLEESPLATRLDASLVHVQVGIKAKATGSTPRKANTPPSARAARHYPSPRPSPVGPSCSLSPSPSPAPILQDLPPTSSKRGSSALSGIGEEKGGPSKHCPRSIRVAQSHQNPKGNRLLSISFTSPEASLPSPVSSAFNETELRPPPHCPAAPAFKRKRRLSDAEGLPSPKRTQTASTSPRPHTDSNTLPVAHATTAQFDWNQIRDYFTIPAPVSLFPADIAEPVDVSLFDFSIWEQYEAVDLLREPAASLSSNNFDVEATTSFSPQPVGPLDYGLSLFNSNSQSEPSGLLEDLLLTKESGLYSIPNISSDFVPPPADQTIDPIVLPMDTNCLPDFPVPLSMTPQAILAQAQVTLEPPVAIPKSGLQAKQEQLRLLQAQVAALAAEIASAS
uniref:Mating-type homeodomain protein n=1 Tax=Coprinellus disseminatus TaxID=71703 RepID=Q1WMS5_COPDI|nr:mating-type homeodomain protein [Coprinellus disseminatus]